MTTRELIERAREALIEALPKVGESENVWCTIHTYHLRDALAAIDAHLSEPQPIHESVKPDDEAVICPACVHQFRAIPVQVQELLHAAGYEPPYLGAPPVAQSDGRKALVWEVKRLADAYSGSTSSENKESWRKLHEAIDRLAAQPVQEPAQAVPNEWAKAVQEAYGWLWHVNNEPMAPVPMWSPEQAAYEARKCLRELLTSGQRGEAINAIQRSLENRIAAAPSAQPTPTAQALSVKRDEWKSLSPEAQKTLESVTARGWVCERCGTDRTKAACPKGHDAALTGECPMFGVDQGSKQ